MFGKRLSFSFGGRFFIYFKLFYKYICFITLLSLYLNIINLKNTMTPKTKHLILDILEKKRVELDNPSKWYLYQELKEINKAINELKQTP